MPSFKKENDVIYLRISSPITGMKGEYSLGTSAIQGMKTREHFEWRKLRCPAWNKANCHISSASYDEEKRKQPRDASKACCERRNEINSFSVYFDDRRWKWSTSKLMGYFSFVKTRLRRRWKIRFKSNENSYKLISFLIIELESSCRYHRKHHTASRENILRRQSSAHSRWLPVISDISAFKNSVGVRLAMIWPAD